MKKLILHLLLLSLVLWAASCQEPLPPVVEEPVPEKPEEGFVEAVEENEEHTPETAELVRKAVLPLVEAGADKIVLGCTHYPFLSKAIAAEP